MKICSIEGCGKPHLSRGWCNAHYSGWYKRGTTDLDISLKKHLSESFEEVDKTECWNWKRSSYRQGYGQAYWNKKRHRVHRLVYESYHGKIPDNLFFCHKCDNPRCVNPHHLFLGNASDNNKDRAQKRRSADSRGENHPHPKLTNGQVIEIKEMLLKNVKGTEIAKIYNVVPTTIYEIKAGRSWKHINLKENSDG